MYGLAPYSSGPIGASSTPPSDIVAVIGPNYYGAAAFGDIGEFLGTRESGAIYAQSNITLTPVVSSTIGHGIAGACVVSLSPIVMIGADTIPRTSTVVVDSILTVSLTSTIPVYAVGLIAPVVSVSASGSTTVRGTAAIPCTVTVAISGSQRMPIVANIIAKVVVSATAGVLPTVTASIRPVVSVSGSGLVVTHGRGAITIPAYVSAAARTGFVGSVSATIRAVFSATAAHSKAATAPIAVPISFAGALKHGCAIGGAIYPQVSVAVLSGAYSTVQASAAINIPLYPYIRCTFGDDLAHADCAYVLTKQLSVSVFQ